MVRKKAVLPRSSGPAPVVMALKGKAGTPGRSTTGRSWRSISDQALRRYVITGRPDLGMPDYATAKDRGEHYQPLSSAEIDDLVALLAQWRRTGPSDGR